MLLGLPLLLVLLGVRSPCSWLELILALAEGIIERSWVWESLSSLDEFDHLSSFGDFDGFGFILIIGHREWSMYDLI